ncbi:tetratricopeptide repeat protein [Vitiosangium sp. GDMCC 1.1324]|uniref:tetratricopeptide repeat protein n=1 Tax=Vitiosangium sp. (strain GDMCC 1.1324) TaxID=2138576 RepID=UPI001E4D2FD5|nr:tetratricopeptide repeat protein [Vitiosangium sp. GDMCC 1.1324]
MPDLVERHRQRATRLLNEGQAARAFGELVRASRALPMTPRLASALVTFSLRAGTEAAAIALLSSSLGNTRGDTRRAVRLQLARVLRRVNQLPRAVEALQALVDEAPGDRRARRLLDVLFRRISGEEITPQDSSESLASASPVPQAEEGSGVFPIVQGEALEDVPEPVRQDASAAEDLAHRSETVEFSAPWLEDEHTVEVSGPPDARFVPRSPPPEAKAKALEGPADDRHGTLLEMPAPGAKAPEEPADDRHGTLLEMPAPWLQDEATSEASDLPFALAQSPTSAPRDDSAGDASSHRRTTVDVTPYLPEEEETSTEPPVSRLESPLIPLPAGLKTDAPIPWGGDEDTVPSRQLVPRQEDPEETRQEAQLIARQAWRELAQFYLASADRAKDLGVRADTLTRLAELLEDELQDTAGAARVYGQIVALTGDRAALAEQVRLLSQRADGDDWVVRRVLDEAVQRASNPRARAAAFLARGERLLSTGERDRARPDFEAAVAISPHSIPALMGLARCVADADRAGTTERLRAALAAVPRRTPHRAEGLRCLAELAGGALADARLAHWAWSEVLAESPEDVLAQDQLLELTRQLGDRAGLSRLLRARLAREPRGLVARKARLELVATLEALGEPEAALVELRQAVRFEPGHKEAWLLLVDRLIALGKSGEAAWAMEHAATATEDDEERRGTWERLARFCREVLGDAARAQVYANRAENLRTAIVERAAPSMHPESPRSAVPRREPSGPRTAILIPPPGSVELTPTPAASAPAALESAPTVLEMPAVVVTLSAKPEAPASPPPRAREPAAPVSRSPLAPEPPAAPMPVEGTRVIAWEAPPGKMDAVRRRARGAATGVSAPGVPEAPAPVASGGPTAAPAKPAPAPVPAQMETARPAAIERVRERPLDAAAYRELSVFFSGRGDTARGSLMAEVAAALVGEKGGAVPRPLRRTLTPEERAGLRHPGLRNPAGELLASVGQALCRLFPTFGRAAGSSEPLRPDSGPGARAALEAVQSVARLLDVQLPELFLSEDEGPPFSLVHPGGPRLLVGRGAVRQVLPEPELRFFAGRALSCLGPDLLALRCLKKDQLLRAVAILASVLRGGTEFGPEARVVREALHPRARERALVLLEAAQREFDAAALAEAARHSANRAGLVACGGPGPAVAALRALKSSEQELVELVRFSASERYLPLRG